MAARAESVQLHPPFPRWLLAPVLGTCVVALIALLRKRAREPSLPRMSEAWLHENDIQSGKDPSLQ